MIRLAYLCLWSLDNVKGFPDVPGMRRVVISAWRPSRLAAFIRAKVQDPGGSGLTARDGRRLTHNRVWRPLFA